MRILRSATLALAAVFILASAAACGSSADQPYTIDGVGHGWPPPEVAPASQTIWDFLAAHPKR
jgi:ABC-type glycerol-3-phosphate transport system substrate-binding protein